METYNLLTGEEMYFSEGTSAKHAVIISYAMENGLSGLLATQGLEAVSAKVSGNILESEKTVSCGDWSAIK